MVAKEKEKIYIIDGSSYFFRAFYAIQRLSNSKGFPTNAIFGFINMLLKVLEVEKPKHLAIAFDTAKPSFRKEIFKEYKANREAPPEDLIVQIPHILRSVDCFGIKRLEKEGFEADDIIGTLAKKAEEEGYSVEIITCDKDLMQLVTDAVTIYDTMKDKRYNLEGVKEKFGVEAHQVIDYLGLMGDASDNIPGVSGVGEKTAADLLNQFGSMEGIYKNLDKIKQEKRRETLRSEKETAFLSRELATVKCDVPLKFEWEELSYKGPKLNELKAFLEEMEFQNLMKRFEFKTDDAKFKKGHYKTIDTKKELEALIHACEKAGLIAIDTETTSLSPHSAKLVGISISYAETEAAYIPVGHCPIGAPEVLVMGQLSNELVLEELRSLLENPKVKKVGQNLKYDLQILRKWGVEVRGVVGDTLLESYLLDPEQSHSLDALALRHFGHQNISYEEVTGKGKSQISFAEVSIEKATQYSSEDADVTYRLYQLLNPMLRAEGLNSLYEKTEVPLVEVLADMEFTGICVDRKRLLGMDEALTEDISAVEDKIFEMGGGAFNINSPKQLSHVLFDKLGLPVVRKTKTGVSTDESVLQELSKSHEICQWILKYREFNKLKSTYVQGLLEQIHPETQRIHTSFNQTVTATGRLSSSNPNLQNIPTIEDPRYDVRSAFIAGTGKKLLSADYSQVELRILADMSEDHELMRAFKHNEDVHEHTARLIFKTKSVSSEQRKVAKTINFGVVYGQTPYGLSQTLKISPGEAKAFIDAYFETYSGVKEFLQSLIEVARQKGFVTTRLGRRRFIPEINSQNRMRREMAERTAINTPIQGTAADMIKLAMLSTYQKLKEENLKSKILLQVHDELVLEVPENEEEIAEKILKSEMEGAMPLKVPLKVDMGWGKNWRECE
ncbi:MAG: DNA polymerase I [Proteobacteria bacterium]|nr:DNA polymerase I [Pseudomonadota bacterium]